MAHYTATVGFETDKLDPETGNPKTKKAKFLVQGDSFYEAHMNLIEYLKDDTRGNDVVSLVKSNFEDVLSVKAGKVTALG